MVLARFYGLSSYDAAYLELAVRESLTLASLDRTLVRAAEKAGIGIYLEEEQEKRVSTLFLFGELYTVPF